MSTVKKLNLSNGSSFGLKHMLESNKPFQYERLENSTAITLQDKATLTHDEHGPMVLPKGDYHVYNQVEWNPFDQSLSYIFD
jgi:hypothetical protein